MGGGVECSGGGERQGGEEEHPPILPERPLCPPPSTVVLASSLQQSGLYVTRCGVLRDVGVGDAMLGGWFFTGAPLVKDCTVTVYTSLIIIMLC